MTHALKPGRLAWAQIVAGGATVNGAAVSAGDGVAIEDADKATIAAGADGTEVLLFDMAE